MRIQTCFAQMAIEGGLFSTETENEKIKTEYLVSGEKEEMIPKNGEIKECVTSTTATVKRTKTMSTLPKATSVESTLRRRSSHALPLRTLFGS